MTRRWRARERHHQLVNCIFLLLADSLNAITEIECLRIRLNRQSASFLQAFTRLFAVLRSTEQLLRLDMIATTLFCSWIYRHLN